MLPATQENQSEKSELRPEERALLLGDLSRLSPIQRGDLYKRVCDSLGLNPLTQPFQYLELKGKLTFYASRNCTDQLRALKNVSVIIASREKVEDIYIVTARASLPNGRSDESIGSVAIGGLKGEALANALMKCETKAKRRVTLSICGLSFMDETEVETIPGAKEINVEQAHAIEAKPAPTPEPIKKMTPEEIETAALNSFSDDPLDKLIKIGSRAGKKMSEVPEQELIEAVKKTREMLTKNPTSPVAAKLAEFQADATYFLKTMGVEI